MSHVRAQLLAEVKTALSANPAIAKVYGQRVVPTRQMWPSVLVYAENESIQVLEFVSTRQYMRELTLVCKGYVRPTQDEEAGENSLDSLSVEIEDTLKATILTAEKDLSLVSVDWGQEESGDYILLTISLTYRILYTTTEYLPETAT